MTSRLRQGGEKKTTSWKSIDIDKCLVSLLLYIFLWFEDFTEQMGAAVGEFRPRAGGKAPL